MPDVLARRTSRLKYTLFVKGFFHWIAQQLQKVTNPSADRIYATVAFWVEEI